MTDRIEEVTARMEEAEKAFEAINSYSCVIHCHERIKGKIRKPESIFSRFKKPNSVYLRWQRGPYEGLQASHVPHRDGAGKFMARETGLKGLAGAVTFPHDSPLIDKAYPHHFRTHETSIQHLLALSLDIQKRAKELGKFTVLELNSGLADPLLHKPVTKIVCELSQSPADGLRWPRTEFYMDEETRLPLHFKLHDFDGQLFGEFAFAEFKPNVALTDADFELKKL